METLDQRLERVETEFKELQYLKLKTEYAHHSEEEEECIHSVNGTIGLLAYAPVTIAGVSTEAMLDIPDQQSTSSPSPCSSKLGR